MDNAIPILTALLGLLGGLAIALFRERAATRRFESESSSGEKAKREHLAREILDLEFVQARSSGRVSPYAAISHFVVLKELLAKENDLELGADLQTKMESIQFMYQNMCWPESEAKVDQDKVRTLMATPEGTNSLEFLESLKKLLMSGDSSN